MVISAEMSVLAAIIRSVSLTRLPGGTDMPRTGPRKKCAPGCECKRHNRARKINWDDPEERRTYNRDKHREAYAADPGPQIEASRLWRKNNPGRRAAWSRVANREFLYGMSDQGLADWIERQGGRCYIGGELLDLDNPRGIHVDHDHSCCPERKSCGQCIRGIACGNHNTGIGLFGDSPEALRLAADRLEAAQAEVAARLAAKPVQAELFDINEAARRREKESALWLLAKALGACSTSSRRSASTRAP
jgi:hypothetical protein